MVEFLEIQFNVFGTLMVLMNMIFLIALWRDQRANQLDWTGLVSRDGKKASTTRVLQLLGGFTSTWVIVYLTLGGKITWDMFIIYLAYVASVEGFSKFVAAKYKADKS